MSCVAKLLNNYFQISGGTSSKYYISKLTRKAYKKIWECILRV